MIPRVLQHVAVVHGHQGNGFRHIERCAGCRAYLEQMRETIRVTGELTPDSITPEAERTLLDAFRDWETD